MEGWKALPVATVAALALLGSAAAQPRAKPAPRPLLGIVVDQLEPQRESLVRVNRRTLRPLPGFRLRFGGLFSGAWSYSPDGRALAFGVTDGAAANSGALYVVGRSQRDVRWSVLVRRGVPRAVAWLAPDRLVAISTRCCSEAAILDVLDPVAQKLVQQQVLSAGDPVSAARAKDKLVVLLGRGAGALLVAVDGDSIRSVDLGGVPASRTALAVTRDGRRALLVAPSGVIHEVDLATLRVREHAVLAAASFRRGRVLPNGLLAVSGSTDRSCVDANGNAGVERTPAGLQLVDTATWTARMVDPNASRFAVGGGSLLAGASRGCHSGRFYVQIPGGTVKPPIIGSGLTAYTYDGARRFRRFDSRDAFVDQVFGHRAFVAVNPEDRLRIVDVKTGRTLGTRPWDKVPLLLSSVSSAG